MANTVIQIKRSTVTTAPTAGSLAAAEPAYSYLSDKLFLGSSDGSQVIEIGGRYYINVAIQAYEAANTANDRAVAAFNAANSAITSSSGPAFDKANAANIIASLAFDKANSANLLAYNTGIGANAFTSETIAGANAAVGTGANAFASATIAGANTAVGAGANAFATSAAAGANAYMIATQNGSNTAVGAGANAFASATIAGANTAVGTGANNFTSATVAGANTAVGAGANAFASATIAGANTAVGTGANNYSNATFVKLVAPNQSITGNLAITGSLTVSGNTYVLDTENLRVSDPLIYLAGNNYTSDIVDIGFIANYVNATGQNVHTGLYREHTDKMYYLFQGYDAEPINNHIGALSNNMTLAVLNADLRTSNLSLAGVNAITWITSAFDKANAANVLAFNTGIGANAFAAATIAGANAAVGAGANAFASATISGANSFFTATIAGANTAVGAGANAFSAATIAGANTAVGAGANAYATAVGAAANTNAANASYINTGTLAVSYGGTGLNTLANNGVLFGNTTGPIRLASTSTEGHVLQANQFGTPFFGMLDGGTF